MFSADQLRRAFLPGCRQILRACVGVRHQHGHARAVSQLHDHLRRRAEVERALHLTLDARAVAAGVLRVEHQLLRTHHGVGAPRPRASGSSVRTVGPASSSSSVPAPLAETTSPGIRFDTPMKPATKVVAGRS